MDLTAELLEEALATLGVVLESRGHSFEVVAIGGGSMVLLGMIRRPAKAFPIVAVCDATGLSNPEPLPGPLQEACETVASALGLAPDWFSPRPSALLASGLPDGFATRSTTRDFGGLVVHLAGRFDQVCFEFHAAVEEGPQSEHMQDLADLTPTPEELRAAAAWARTHDSSDGFGSMSVRALAALGVKEEAS